MDSNNKETAPEEAKDVAMADATHDDDDQSDVELEGVDLDEDEEAADADATNDEDLEENASDKNMNDAKSEENDDDAKARQTEDAEELEEAKRERLQLLEAERKKLSREEAPVDPKEKFDYLLQQSDVFAHFLAGSVAADAKKSKKGGRGKKGRMTEEEEDAQLLKSAQMKRKTIRLEKQPGNLAPHCEMHGYQLEGLNWLIKLHDHGINGILADEVSRYVWYVYGCSLDILH